AEKRVNVPVEQRSVGMVFQSYAIWPHMTVAENVAFPFTVARHRRYTRTEIAEGVKRALAVVDLDGFQQRAATRLPGGHQRRVAAARSRCSAVAASAASSPRGWRRRPRCRCRSGRKAFTWSPRGRAPATARTIVWLGASAGSPSSAPPAGSM